MDQEHDLKQGKNNAKVVVYCVDRIGLIMLLLLATVLLLTIMFPLVEGFCIRCEALSESGVLSYSKVLNIVLDICKWGSVALIITFVIRSAIHIQNDDIRGLVFWVGFFVTLCVGTEIALELEIVEGALETILSVTDFIAACLFTLLCMTYIAYTTEYLTQKFGVKPNLDFCGFLGMEDVADDFHIESK